MFGSRAMQPPSAAHRGQPIPMPSDRYGTWPGTLGSPKAAHSVSTLKRSDQLLVCNQPSKPLSPRGIEPPSAACRHEAGHGVANHPVTSSVVRVSAVVSSLVSEQATVWSHSELQR